MNDLIKHSGLILFIIAIALVIYGTTSNVQSNAPFIFALILMIGGILSYIILNRIFEE